MRQQRLIVLRVALVWAALAATITVVCLFSSLMGRLGYAFSFVVTPPLALAALHLGGRIGRLSTDAGPLARLGQTLLGWLPVGAAPLVVMAASAPFSRSCGIESGLRWYGMLPVASSIVAALVGLGLATRGKRLVFLWPVATLGVALWFQYRDLPVFAYDPFWGYFPGSLYDEQVSVRPAFYWARLYHLTAGLAVFALFVPRASRWWRAAAVPLLGGAIALAGLAPQLGFRQSNDTIIAALGGTRQTEHFTIYYPKKTADATIDQLANECEFRYARLVELLGRGPQHIAIFFFDSIESKQLWTGLQGTSIARPWQYTIVTHDLSVPHDSLNHELVHAFFGDYGGPLGMPWRGVDVASGLVEGVAVALDDDDGDDQVHGLSQTMKKAGLLPPLSELLSLRFLLHPPTRAYTAAGSFCRFLLAERSGADLAAVYASGAKESVLTARYGRTLAQLERDWWAFLDARPQPPVTVESRDALQRPSIFARRCAHELATKRQRAFAAMAGNVDVGLKLLQEICAEDPERPEHLALVLREAMNRHRPQLAEKTAWTLLSHPASGERYVAQAAEALGDLAIQTGDRFSALGYFVLANRTPAEPQVGRLRTVKQHAASLAPGPLADAMVKFLYQSGGKREQAVSLVALAPNEGLYAYLLGRQLDGRDAVAAFDRALQLGLPDARFTKAALQLGVENAVEAGAFADAARLADALLRAGEPSGAVWLRRIAFLARVDKSRRNF